MLGAAAARVGFSLGFSLWATAVLPAAQTSRLFQLLLLQGGLVALQSASAYARGAYVGSIGSAASSARRFAAYVVTTASIALTGGVVFVPTGETFSKSVLLVALLVLGAGASAVTAFFQGVLVARGFSTTAFGSAVVANVLGSLLLGMGWGGTALGVAVAVWVSPQVGTLALLLLLRRHRRSVLSKPGASEASLPNNQFAATGIANSGSVWVNYAFRERWSAVHTAEQVADTFLLARITEVVYQVFYMVGASLPIALQRVLQRHAGRVWGMALALLIVSSGCTLLLALQVNTWAWGSLLIAEALVAPTRVITAVCLLSLLARPSTRAYQIVVAASVVAALLIMWVPQVQESPLALQAFQAVAGLAIVPLAATILRRQVTA